MKFRYLAVILELQLFKEARQRIDERAVSRTRVLTLKERWSFELVRDCSGAAPPHPSLRLEKARQAKQEVGGQFLKPKKRKKKIGDIQGQLQW
jgi:hypothetical protein